LSSLIVVTLALGIGANAAIFSMVDAVWLRPLPYDRPETLISLWEQTKSSARTSVAPGNLQDYQRLEAFEELASFTQATVVLGLEMPQEVSVERVSVNLFSMLGVRPAAGRLFSPADAGPGGERVVAVGDAFWRTRLAADPLAVGREIDINRTRHRIVGVLPATFTPLSAYASANAFEIFLPIVPPAGQPPRNDREWRVIGRLRTGVTLEQARAQLKAAGQTLAAAYPETNREVIPHLASLPADLSRGVRSSLHIVLGVVAVITLIGCVNVANLLLVWASGRRRDVGVRLALGADRRDLVAESLWRGALYGAAGGVAGLLLAVWAIAGLVAIAPPSVIPHAFDVSLNARVIAAAVALALASGLAASVAPTWRMLRQRVAPVLRETSASVSESRRLLAWRGVLLAVQVASAVTLALGAGLLIRSVALLGAVNLGFETDRVVTMSIRLPEQRYPDPPARVRFFEDLRARVVRLPGVESLAYANQFPMRGGWGGGILAESRSGPIAGDTDLQAVSHDYFATLGFRLLQGRGFAATDTATSPGVAVISRTFADRFFPGESPIGRIIRRTESSPPVQVIGVVGEVRRDGKFEQPTAQVYFSAQQTSLYSAELSALAIRGTGDPLALVGGIRQIVAGMDGMLVVGGVRALDDVLNASSARLRFHTWLLSLMAGQSLRLCLVGVYSVASHVVAQRTREFGVRVALGATRRQVIAAAMASAARWTAVGIAIGASAAAVLSRVLASLLFETTPHDLVTFVFVTAAVAGVSLAAAWLPARRAASGDPLIALRGDQ
jgi:putative ABC transport system permease protein